MPLTAPFHTPATPRNWVRSPALNVRGTPLPAAGVPEGFSDIGERGRDLAVRQKDRVDRTLPIRKVAQSAKFYDDDVEQRLAEIEGRTNTVLKQD
jgi:hypothetical protein